MSLQNEGTLRQLIASAIGPSAATQILDALSIKPELLREGGSSVSRGAFSMALNAILFDDLLRRVPSGAAYVAETIASGATVVFDHGALRTVRFVDCPTGALPGGHAAFTRILEPLGYEMATVYPLPKLRMTGRAYVHADAPDAIPQFFLSELHADQFSSPFRQVAGRVFGASLDPLNDQAKQLLSSFAAGEKVPLDAAAEALPIIAGAFGRHHPIISEADYEALLAESAEAAWIATEGNAFNHATDRVADVTALADRLRAQGWPIKDKIEISASGRVRQTALRADGIERVFRNAAGATVTRVVPGSFYEFISRDRDCDGVLDLGFDSANATGIFAMTRAA